MPLFIVQSGKIGRRESGGLVVYGVNDKIELTLASALGLGAQVAPADRATAIAVAEATTVAPSADVPASVSVAHEAPETSPKQPTVQPAARPTKRATRGQRR